MSISTKIKESIKILIDSKEKFAKYKINQNFDVDFKFLKEVGEEENEDNENYLYIEGYACTADQDLVDDVITDEAMLKSKDDLLRPGCKTVFYNHDTDMAIGIVEKSYFDGNGIKVRVKISNADDVKDIRTKLKEGILNSFSIRGYFKNIEIDKDDHGNIIAWKVLEMDLMEVSVVGLPCNRMASIVESIEKSIEKSIGCFVKKVSKKNTKNSDKAKKVKTDKKKRSDTVADEKTILAVLKEHSGAIIDEQVKASVVEAVDKALTPINEQIEKVVEHVKNIGEAIEASKVGDNDDSDEDKKKKEKKDADNEVKVPDWAKTLEESIAGITKTVDELKAEKNKRKGYQRTEEDDLEDNEDNSNTPKKALKGIEDEDTLKYVVWLAQDPEGNEAYAKLEGLDKEKAKGLMFIMQNEMSKTRD